MSIKSKMLLTVTDQLLLLRPTEPTVVIASLQCVKDGTIEHSCRCSHPATVLIVSPTKKKPTRPVLASHLRKIRLVFPKHDWKYFCFCNILRGTSSGVHGTPRHSCLAAIFVVYSLNGSVVEEGAVPSFHQWRARSPSGKQLFDKQQWLPCLSHETDQEVRSCREYTQKYSFSLAFYCSRKMQSAMLQAGSTYMYNR